MHFNVTNMNQRIEIAINTNGINILDLTSDANIITDTNFHHFVITSNGSAIRLYIDGVEKTLTSSIGSNTGQWFDDATTATNIFTLGAIKRISLAAVFDGKLDEPRVYSRALAADEIKALYEVPSGIAHEGNAIAYLEGREKDTARPVTGWARAMMGKSAAEQPSGSWDGWIKLSGIAKDGAPYGLSLNKDTSEITGWMYGGDVIGWISANCENRESCETAPYSIVVF